MSPDVVTVGVFSESGLVEAGLAAMLARASDRIQVREGLHADALDAIEWIDVALFDLYGRFDGVERTVRSLVDHPSVGTVAVLALDFPPAVVREARAVGVRSFISKALPPAELVEALLLTARGRAVDAFGARTGGPVSGWPGRAEGLSERESQVLVLAAEGMSNREIAELLFVSVETVRTHLRRAYHHLGVHNRAQAAAFVHATRAGAWMAGADRRDAGALGQRVGDPVDSGPPEPLSLDGFDEVSIAQRRMLLGLDDAAGARLRHLAPLARARSVRFVEGLVARWLACDETAVHLRDERVRSRLADHHHWYLGALFASEHDQSHIEAMLMMGAVHHRIRLPPQWYLASCAHLICDHLPLIWTDAADDEAAIEAVIALVRAALFDASLVLDAYEMCVEREIARRFAAAPATPTPSLTVVDAVPEPTPVVRRQRQMTAMPLTTDQADVRRQFLEIDHGVMAALRALGPVVAGAVPAMLESFYALVGRVESIAVLVPTETVDRLLREVATYWRELMVSGFDRAHAASRMRVGVIHERIGLAMQSYLAGLVHQLSGLLRALVRPGADVARDADALLRAVLFDVTFVIDAYMEARATSLMQISRFAGQVVAGLANGIAVVDARNRVEHANERLLELVGVPAGVLHRLPLASALPFDGVEALIDAARASGEGRATALYAAWNRRFHVTAIAMQRSMSAREGLVAVVLDDITDVVRASDEMDREARRLDHVLDAVDAIVWEMDRELLTVLAVSRGSARLLGVRDTDLLGRRSLVDRVHPDDQDAFMAMCRGVEDGQSRGLDHRLQTVDGSLRRVRTTIAGTRDPSGAPTVSGVTVDLTPLPDPVITPAGGR